MKITGTDGEFNGAFKENEVMKVNANALLRLVNSFKSGHTHRVLEHWALRNHEGSEIDILTNNILAHAGIANRVEMVAPYSDQLPEPFMVGDVIEKFGDDLQLADSFFRVGNESSVVRYVIVLGANVDTRDIYVGVNIPGKKFKAWTVHPDQLKKVRVQDKISEIEVNTLLPYIKQLIEAAERNKVGNFMVGEIVRRESGGLFVDENAGVSTHEAVIAGMSNDGSEVIYSLPRGNVTLWRDSIRFLSHVESTGRHISPEALAYLLTCVKNDKG